MGSVFNRGSPERPNIWIKYRDVDGMLKRRSIGHVNPAGLSKREVRAKERQLRKLASQTIARIELDIAAGKAGFEDTSMPKETDRLFSDVGLPWAKKRRKTHRSGKDSEGIMKNHLIPHFGQLRLCSISTKQVKSFIDDKRGILKRQTIINCLNLLSRFFNDLIEDEQELVNPVARLDRATRRAIGPKYDPRTTPFLKRKEDIRHIYVALPRQTRAMFAVGAFAGLRTGEILALEWGDVDLKRRVIKVERQATGQLKDHETRFVPINDTLLPVMREWKLASPPDPQCFRPLVLSRGGRKGRPARYVRPHTIHGHLRKALKACKLPEELTWYQCTRHTFASQWVTDGGSIEKLRMILGHASVVTTERYAHLAPDAFNERDYSTATVDLTEPKKDEKRQTWAAVFLWINRAI